MADPAANPIQGDNDFDLSICDPGVGGRWRKSQFTRPKSVGDTHPSFLQAQGRKRNAHLPIYDLENALKLHRPPSFYALKADLAAQPVQARLRTVRKYTPAPRPCPSQIHAGARCVNTRLPIAGRIAHAFPAALQADLAAQPLQAGLQT